jgi:hypothetical protein
METPKLLWLKENRPDTFNTAQHFFDLADSLSWRATGSFDRSICTTTCKWTYLGHEHHWDEGHFRAIGLSEIADEGFARIGTRILDAGTAVSIMAEISRFPCRFPANRVFANSGKANVPCLIYHSSFLRLAAYGCGFRRVRTRIEGNNVNACLSTQRTANLNRLSVWPEISH